MRQILLLSILTILFVAVHGQEAKTDSTFRPADGKSYKSLDSVKSTFAGVVESKPDWRTVKVVVFDSTGFPTNFTSTAEAFFTFKNRPKTVDKIKSRQLKELKKFATHWSGTTVYVDLKQLWTRDNDFREKNEYYILVLTELKK